MSSFQSATTRQGLHRRNMNSGTPQSEFIQRLRRSPPSESSSSTPSSSSSSSSTTTTSNTSGKKKKTAPSASDFYVPSLPGQPKDSQLILYAGHLSFSPPDTTIEPEKDSYGFFFLNKARHIANRPVLLVWLNGGPGCSSFDGSLMEVGPLRMVLKGDGTLKEVDAAWNEYANMLFIDQPTGTGYSYGPKPNYVHELDVSSANLVNLLARFFKIFPEYQQMDLYICGESFAGQYIPYLAQAILDTNIISAPLKGIMIGNGWIDPINQYLAYPEFAFKVGLVNPSSKAADLVNEELKKCTEWIDSNSTTPIHIEACEGILSAITDSTVQTVNSQKMCLNMYDVRLVDSYPACGLTWPPDLADITPYLSRTDVKQALHAQDHAADWVECEAKVGNNFWAKTSQPSVTLFPKLLDKIKILLFSGDQDLICCHTGTERMIDHLTWAGHQGWTSQAINQPWKVNGSYAGLWKEERNLTYVLVANASHMAPYDVPYVTQDMLVRFLGIDVMTAAGPAAQITSRIGEETATKVNRVVMNETKLGQEGSGTTGGLAMTSGPVHDENYYNASSAMLFLTLVGLVVGLIFFVRRRLRRDGHGDFAHHPSDETEIILKNHHHHHHLSPDSSLPRSARDRQFQPVPTDDLDDHHLHPNLPSNNTSYQDLPR
ncbi:Cell death protease [Puccinia graminis f. sp. tritici]|uniref:Pheromone-processing carboxypeptidase KEX1 n=1 Tax=Puccinia graminis f. sp. tritici TaxID=56615 RepID=A0A5B0SCD0_PUCGR|nr:Cell death protease [Puccinia graminis f. sp. tritici]KAA1134094.1 Cell death protease [Puccinia graminis f. sp. tritici]